jgi:hypothetical protein
MPGDLPWKVTGEVPAVGANPLNAYAAAVLVSSLMTMDAGKVPHAPSAETSWMCEFAAAPPTWPPLAATYIRVFVAGQLKLSENLPLASVDTLVPTWAAVAPVDQTLSVAPTIAVEPARTVPLSAVEPVVPPDEEPPEDELLLEVPPEDELEEELLEEVPLLEEEVPPLLDDDELLELLLPLLLEEEDEDEEEEEETGGGAAPPPPPPPHATNVTETANVIDLKRNLTFSGMRLFPQNFLCGQRLQMTNRVRFATSADVDGYATQGSPKTAALSYRSCASVLAVTVGRDIS